MNALPTPQQTLELAERIAEALEERRIDAVVIGGWALAVHNYPRATRDLDLGVNTDVNALETLGVELRAEGHQVEVMHPGGDDPLGGVLTVEATTGAIVQVVNFQGVASGFPAAIRDAVANAAPPADGSRLRVVPLPQLIALKLYAGGAKSRADVSQLLATNLDADIDAIRQLCQRYRVSTRGVF